MKVNSIHDAFGRFGYLKPALAGLLLLGTAVASQAQTDVTMTASDPFGGSAFNTGTRWSDGLAPHAGANYYTAGKQMRTPSPGGSVSFGGDSLTLQPYSGGAALVFKQDNNSVVTVNNLTNAGGMIQNGNGGYTSTLAGRMFLAANSGLTCNGDATRKIIVACALAGSGALSNGYAPTATWGNGSFYYTNNNATDFTGPMVVAGSANIVVGSQTNLGGNPGSFNPAQLILDAGTFTPTASFALNNANSGVTIAAGGGTFSIGSGLTFTNANPFAGSGTLTKSGAGTMVHSGSGASFTGNTIISAGTLALGAGASLTASPVINVASGATLDATANGLTLGVGQQLAGVGAVKGSVTDVSGSSLNAAFSGTPGTLTLSNDLNLVDGGSIAVNWSSTTNGVIVVNGNLSPSGVTHVTIGSTPPGGFTIGNSYVIMKVLGNLGGTAANFAAPGLSQFTFPITYDAVNKVVILTVAGLPPPTLVWQGDVTNGINNAWDLTTTNWLNGTTPSAYADLDAVFFTDAGLNQSGAVNQPTLDVTVNPKSVTFNATNDYTLSGAGAISGSASLTKTNTGLLTLQTTNSYTGGTVVQAGLLAINNPAALGNPAAASSLVVVSNGAALDLNGQQMASSQFAVVNGAGLSSSQPALFSTVGMGNTYGQTPKGLRKLRLSGNAAIGGDRIWQIGTDVLSGIPRDGLGSIDAQGFSLTKVGTGILVLEATNASPASQLVIAEGGVTLFNGYAALGAACPIAISNNASLRLQGYSAALANPIAVGPGGGSLYNGDPAGQYGVAVNLNLSGPITVNDTLSVFNLYSYSPPPYYTPVVAPVNFNGGIAGTGTVFCVGPTTQLLGANNPFYLNGSNTFGLMVVSNYAVLNLNGDSQARGNYLLTDQGGLNVVPVAAHPTLSMASLTIDNQILGAPYISFDRLSSMPTNPVIHATNLTITANVGYVNIIPPKAGYAIGQFPLIQYDGNIGGVGFSFSVANGAFPRGVTASLVDNSANHTIDLLVTDAGMRWTGANSSDWDIGMTQNWLNPQSQQPDYYYDGDIVLFDSTAANRTVNIPVSVAPIGITVNATNDYTFGGPGGITNTAALIKNGSGTLTVANTNNTFTGGTYINGGTLKLGDLIYVPPYVGGALNNNGGKVYVSSGGTLDANGRRVNDVSPTLGPGGYDVYITGGGVGGLGALVNNNPANNENACVGAVTLTGDATIGGTGDLNILYGFNQLNSQSSDYTLTKAGSGRFRIRAGSVSTNFGAIKVLGGIFSVEAYMTSDFGDATKLITIGNGGTLAWGTQLPLCVRPLICSNGASLLAINTGISIGSPIQLVSGTVTFNTSLTNSMTLTNVIGGLGGVFIASNSTVTLTASNNYTGNTTVGNSSDGTGSVLRLTGAASIDSSPNLILQGSTPAAPTAATLDASGRTGGTLTLASGQTLRGDNGSVVKGTVVASSGAIIAPGGAANFQSMTFNNNLTLQLGSTFAVDISANSGVITNDAVTVAGTATYGGTLHVANLGSGNVPLGTAFKLFTAGTGTGSFSSIVGSPGGGLVYEFTPATGVLTVVSPVNTTPTNVTVAAGNGNLTLSWPADHIGWRLLQQTNHLSQGISLNANDWGTVAGSAVTNQMILPIDAAKPADFFRLVYP